MNLTELYFLTKRVKRTRVIPSRTNTRENSQHLNLTEWNDERCKIMTRFTYNEIVRICNSIGLEGSMLFEELCIARELSLAILLNRLSFPRRNIDMQYTFGIHKNNISKIVNGLSKLLYEKFKTGIEFDERQFSKENLERFSKAIFERGAYFFNGSNNGPGIFNSSQVFSRLNYHFGEVSPEKYYAIYGDETYSLSKYIIPPFNGDTMDDIEKETNVSMSKVRVAVEMEFGKTATYFSGSKWKYGNRILQTKPALKYMLAVIFKNIHTCLHGSPVNKIFRLDPPTLEGYINGLM